MACKHEGGHDPCKRYASSGGCIVRAKQTGDKYRERSLKKTGVKVHENLNRGLAGEHFVISELLRRQVLVGRPVNSQTKHDMFAFLSGSWRTIQVKVSNVNTITGTIRRAHGGYEIESDLAAFVDLEGKRIRWISKTDEPVPEELL